MVEALADAPINSTMANNIGSPPSLYVRNMCELWRCDARLAMAIDAVHPADLPPIEQTRDGNATVKINNIYLHSRYRPVQEADSWAATIKCEDKYVLIVSGFALGYHVKSLFARMPADALLLIAEPNIPLLRAAFETVDFSEMLSSRRIFFFTTLDRGDLVNRLEPRAVMFTAGEGTLFAAHPASLQVAGPGGGDFHSNFQKLITEFVAFTRIGFVTLMLNNVLTC